MLVALIIYFAGHCMLTADRVTHARQHFWLDPRSPDQQVINVVLECSGSELQLLSCPQKSSSQSTCTETGVYCYGKLKLS